MMVMVYTEGNGNEPLFSRLFVHPLPGRTVAQFPCPTPGGREEEPRAASSGIRPRKGVGLDGGAFFVFCLFSFPSALHYPLTEEDNGREFHILLGTVGICQNLRQENGRAVLRALHLGKKRRRVRDPNLSPTSLWMPRPRPNSPKPSSTPGHWDLNLLLVPFPNEPIWPVRSLLAGNLLLTVHLNSQLRYPTTVIPRRGIRPHNSLPRLKNAPPTPDPSQTYSPRPARWYHRPCSSSLPRSASILLLVCTSSRCSGPARRMYIWLSGYGEAEGRVSESQEARTRDPERTGTVEAFSIPDFPLLLPEDPPECAQPRGTLELTGWDARGHRVKCETGPSFVQSRPTRASQTDSILERPVLSFVIRELLTCSELFMFG
ncbi:uncharacterized protein LOC114816274 [Ornithorhynchus anatinus]|uniref:uncharacterized protein LOC114816274 n=1 Tax=Ornithorhynchus anatinus TaxID=9258 RepID=UPI0010A94606|nr:uncharacterized protein LOC114816274 [Ornithorhynchus anatinus]